ncbi:LptA/OstA family protein [Sphingomonas sp. LHG3406-1]|uniref:LptA/OstA family protein n=1 Tax=Sphingomonas sp. LHG3406-1 TaxID=2804617 RepID=UPI00260EB8E2|nr:LptA/OstA family protein [Sphingomonas sp. LHG3406-1]
MGSLRTFAVAFALTSATAGGVALAQTQGGPVSALKGHNSNAPIDVASDRIEVQDRADRAIFAGNVKVRQAELTLDTQRLTVAYTSTGNLQIDRLDASGGVVVRSPSETARGNFGVYDLNRRIITLIGAVQLERGESRISGARLTIDLDSGRAVVDGGPAGVGESGGRVTGRFTVPQRRGS